MRRLQHRLFTMAILALALALLSAAPSQAKPKPAPVWDCPYEAILDINESHVEGRVVIYDDGSFRLYMDDGSGAEEVEFIAWLCEAQAELEHN